MPAYVVNRIIERMNVLEKPMKNSKILIFGVAYKKDISDTRESPALDIIENFKSKGVEISFYDPFVDSLIVSAFPSLNTVSFNSIILTGSS